MEVARDRLALARLALEGGHPAGAMSAAYYAMLSAGNAALSEDELYAKTHRGVWDLFRQTYVASGRFDEALHAEARGVQRRREDADYNAAAVTSTEAEEVIALAERYVAAIERLVA
jgi:uncharacterized protein (UPF0332 family)